MKTWPRADFLAGSEAWRDFGPEWAEVKRLSREWSCYPPEGSAHDDRDAGRPSQRAIIWRALRDNPSELRKILGQVRSWNGVVVRIIGLETRLRADADDAERDAAWHKKDRPKHHDSLMSIKSIFDRIESS